MDQATLEKMIRAGKITSEEVLARTPIDGLGDMLTFLKQHRGGKEVCRALIERIARAPLEDFGKLKDVVERRARAHVGRAPR